MSETTRAGGESDRARWLKGPQAQCCSIPEAQASPWRLVLLGAPGVGKGTQAELLHQRLGACHLSTGDVFRAAKNLAECERSPAMNHALGYMKRGELVPDEIVLDLVRERVDCLKCGGGFLLDGFPRTVAQARALDELLDQNGLKLSTVISYELPVEQIISRLGGRRTCANCKAVFHVTGRPPRKEGICDECGGRLIIREDDRPEAIRVRMEAYENLTKPLADYYRQRKLLVTVSAAGTPEEIYRRTMEQLTARGA